MEGANYVTEEEKEHYGMMLNKTAIDSIQISENWINLEFEATCRSNIEVKLNLVNRRVHSIKAHRTLQ